MQSIADERGDVKVFAPAGKWGGDCLLGGDFRAGQYSGNLAFAEAEGGVLQVTGGPVFARLLFFEVAEFELMLNGAAFGYFYGCRLVGEIDSTVFVRWTCGC